MTRARPLLSACLIVRDEEHNLPRCLASLRSGVDEIVVVDTGSRDATMRVAKQAGARVFSEPWQDDFSLARNESLRRAHGDWLIWIDADEELVETAGGALRSLCQRSDPGGYLVELRNLDDAGQIESTAMQRRLFPNGRGARFQGRVHEQLVLPEAEWRSQSAACILHHGYADDTVLDRKFHRNLELLERSIALEPDQPAHRYDVGRLLLYGSQPDFELALRHLETGLDLWQRTGRPKLPYLTQLFAFTAWAAVAGNQPERALALESLATTAVGSAPLYHYLGLAAWRLGRAEDAIARLRASLDAPPTTDVLRDETLRPRTLLVLAEVLCDVGQPAEGRELALQAHQLIPAEAEALFVLALAATKLGARDDAIAWARQAAASGTGHWQSQARRILYDLGVQLQDSALQLEALGGDVAGIAPEDVLRLMAQLLSGRLMA